MIDQPAKHFITAGAHRVCYVEGGRAGLPKAIFLHGWIASHQLYRKIWRELGELFHFYALDLVGFGDSDKPAPSTCAYDAPFYAESIRAFADVVGVNAPFTLVAQSMGGIAGAEFAVRYPERLTRLILVDSAGIEVPPPALGRLLQAPVVGKPLFMALGGTRKALKDFLVDDVWFVKSVFEESVLDEMIRVQKQQGAKDAAYATLIRMLSPQAARAFTKRFANVRVPTWLVWGERDRLFPMERCGRMIESKIPGARLLVIPDSGHEPPVEAPAQFIAALGKVLDQSVDRDAPTDPITQAAQ